MSNISATMMRPERPPEEFRLMQGHMIDHPNYGTSVLWDNRSLHLILPFTGEQIRFDLAAFPMNSWVRLQDQSGTPIPVAICVDPRGAVLGRWLP